MDRPILPIRRKIILAGDRNSRPLVDHILQYLIEHDVQVEETVPFFHDVEDYITQAVAVAEWVSDSPETRAGILCCGTGSGVTIIANKFPGVYAVCCRNMKDAEESRKINDANIITFGSSKVDLKKACHILELWLKTPFNSERNNKRLQYIKDIEKKMFKI